MADLITMPENYDSIRTGIVEPLKKRRAPLPPETTQVWTGLLGCCEMVTAKAPPLAIGVANAKAPFWAIGRLSPPSF